MNWPDDFINKIICGDCLEVMKKIPNESIDFVITDPPYTNKTLYLFEELAMAAERILKPSGLLISYCGNFFINQVLAMFDKYLLFYWQLILIHKGHKSYHFHRKVMNGFKPILLYQKEPFRPVKESFKDIIIGTGPEKDSHVWQQAEYEMIRIINQFTKEGDLILDPFLGSGTTARAAKDLKRKYIGIEIISKYSKIAEERLAQGVI